MKAFKTYLAESTRTYDFRIKLACELTTEALDRLKQALEAYQLDEISKPKRLPVRETVDFPQVGPTEVNIVDVKLHYPVNGAQLRAMVAERTGIPSSCVKVIDGGENNPYENILDGKEQSKEWKEGDAVLSQEEMVTEKADDLVGQNRITSIMKELEDARKDSKQSGYTEYKSPTQLINDTVETDTNADKVFQSKKGQTTNDLAQGTKGAISGTNKIVDVNAKG